MDRAFLDAVLVLRAQFFIELADWTGLAGAFFTCWSNHESIS
jgi:hypothetical protein